MNKNLKHQPCAYIGDFLSCAFFTNKAIDSFSGKFAGVAVECKQE